MLSTVTTYPMFLVAALGVGLAGGSFAVRHRIRVAVVRPRASGHRARDVRHRQRRRRGDELRGAVPAPRGWVGPRGAGLRRGAPRHRAPLLRRDEGRPDHRGTQGERRESEIRPPAGRAAEAPAGLAVLSVLLLRLRSVRRPRPVAAPLLRRRLWTRIHDRGHAGCRLCAPRQHLSGPRRIPLRSVRGAARDVLDVHRERGRLLLPELSVDGLRHTGSRGPDRVQRHHLPSGIRVR